VQKCKKLLESLAVYACCGSAPIPPEPFLTILAFILSKIKNETITDLNHLPFPLCSNSTRVQKSKWLIVNKNLLLWIFFFLSCIDERYFRLFAK